MTVDVVISTTSSVSGNVNRDVLPHSGWVSGYVCKVFNLFIYAYFIVNIL